MNVKTSELTGTALDWAVAQCEGWRRELCYLNTEYPTYSTNWSLCGPIIEREGISLDYRPPGGSSDWYAEIADGRIAWSRGDTPLIAAMRCYVAHKLGSEIDIPEELV